MGRCQWRSLADGFVVLGVRLGEGPAAAALVKFEGAIPEESGGADCRGPGRPPCDQGAGLGRAFLLSTPAPPYYLSWWICCGLSLLITHYLLL